MNRETQLHIRCEKSWLNKLDNLVKLENGGTRTNYIKRLIEERYSFNEEIGEIIARSMQEGGKEHGTIEMSGND